MMREFFCVEFNHPVHGWTLLTDTGPHPSFDAAQKAITLRLCNVPQNRREVAARGYRIARYVPEVTQP